MLLLCTRIDPKLGRGRADSRCEPKEQLSRIITQPDRHLSSEILSFEKLADHVPRRQRDWVYHHDLGVDSRLMILTRMDDGNQEAHTPDCVVNLAGPQSELLFWPCGNCDKLRTCPYCLWLLGGLLQWETKKTGSGARRGLHHRVRRVAGRFLRWEQRVPSCVSLKDRPSLGLCDLTRGAIGQGTHHLHSFIPREKQREEQPLSIAASRRPCPVEIE